MPHLCQLAVLLLHREGDSVGGGCSGDRGLERVIAIRQGSGHLDRDLIEARESGRERGAEHRGIGGADLDADRACIVDLVPGHLNAGAATLVAQEAIEALKPLRGIPLGFDYWLGPTADGILREQGIKLVDGLSLIHISEPTRLGMISYAVF